MEDSQKYHPWRHLPEVSKTLAAHIDMDTHVNVYVYIALAVEQSD